MTSKAQAYYDSIRPDRNRWKSEQMAKNPKCWCCGFAPMNEHMLEVHEIAKRSQAPLRWGERCNYFLTCNSCNCGILQWVSVEYQLAIKRLYDLEHFDHIRVNALRGRSEDAVSEVDVMQAIEHIAVHLLIESVNGTQGPDLRHSLEATRHAGG